MSEPILQVQGLSKSFGTLSVLKEVDLTVQRGERIALIGPSGTGKSVFLRCIAMLEKPDTGRVFVGDTDITRRGVDLNLIRQKMGMVYQGFHLFSHMNVLENIIFAPVKVKKTPRGKASEKAAELLDTVGLRDKIYAMPDTLSGGQKQRVAIARCLAMEPDILLLDEPTSALDPTMTAEVMSIIRKLAQTGLTLLLVTHEMNFAKEFASRVLYMDECGVYEQGTPEKVFDSPERAKTIAFLSHQKAYTKHVDSAGFDFVGMNAELEVYFDKNGIDKRRLFDLQLLLEELLALLFREQFSGTVPDIDLTVRYAGASGEVSAALRYGGADFDPFAADGDDLGVMLIRGLCGGKTHEYSDDGNTLSLILRER